MTPADAIARYVDHLDDRAYLARVVDALPTDALVDLLASMLRRHARDVGMGGFADAQLFLRDAKAYVEGPAGDAFRAALAGSAIERAVRDAVVASDVVVRRLALAVYGRHVGDDARFLEEVFDDRLGRDPLCLPAIACTASMLRRWTPARRFLEPMILHPSRMTRWAAIELLDDLPIDDDDRRHALQVLERDPVPWIARDAARLRADDHGAPTTYFVVTLRFHNHLVRSVQRDYTVEALSAFVDDELRRTDDAPSS